MKTFVLTMVALHALTAVINLVLLGLGQFPAKRSDRTSADAALGLVSGAAFACWGWLTLP
jgi:hypothetical protein